jgi:hypothetical protein
MGPKSKEAVVTVLGHVLNELQQQRSVLAHELGELREELRAEIRRMLQASRENVAADLVPVNRRVTELEQAFRRFGGAPSPPR